MYNTLICRLYNTFQLIRLRQEAQLSFAVSPAKLAMRGMVIGRVTLMGLLTIYSTMETNWSRVSPTR